MELGPVEIIIIILILILLFGGNKLPELGKKVMDYLKKTKNEKSNEDNLEEKDSEK